MDDHQLASSSSSPVATNRDPQRKRLSGFFNNLIHRREPPAAIQEEPKTPSKEDESPQPAPAVPPPRLPPPTLQELGLSLSVVTENLHPSHFTTPPSSGAFLSPNYLLLCHAQGLDVLPITSPPEPQPLPLIRRVSFKSIVVMEQRGVLVAIAGRRDGVRVYALEEIRKAVEWRIDVQIKRERERQRREQAKKPAPSLIIEARLSNDKFRKPSSSTPPPGAETSAKVSIPRKSSHSSITPTAATHSVQPPIPPVPLIPRTPTIRKLKPPKKSPALPPSVSSVPSTPEPTGLPPPYPASEASDYFTQPTPIPARATSSVAVRQRSASVSEVLTVPPISRLNTTVDPTRPNDPDAKEHGWTDSDEEAINVVAAGASGSQALDERTSAIHSSTSAQSPAANVHPVITTPPLHSHRRSLSRRNRPANLDLSLTINNPVAPSEPSPAPTLLTLRQALANPSSQNASDNTDSGLVDPDEDDDDDGDGEISLSQALMESRLPDLPPPGSVRPQQAIYINSSLAGGEDEPASPRTSEAHSSRSETLATSSSTNSSNRRRRWSLMLNTSLSGSSSTPSLDRQTASPAVASPTTPVARDHRPNRLSRSHSHRANTSPTPSRRPASANAETHRSNASEPIPPLPSENAPATIPSSSRSRFLPRIISNALHNMRHDDRPSTSPSGFDSDSHRKTNSVASATQPPAAKLEYVKLPGTKGSLTIKAVETAKKSFLAILCGENGEKVELFAGTYRTALGLSRTFILPDSPRSLELQLQGDDLVEVFLVFSQNVFGLEPATVRVREVRIGRAERRAARRRAREARADAANSTGNNENETEPQAEDETNVNVSIGVSVAVGSTVVATGTGPSDPSTPALIPSEHPQQHSEDRPASSEGNVEGTTTPAEGGVTTTTAIAHAEELVALATAQMGPYTTFQQLSFAPRFPLASIADDYVIPPTYPDFMDYKTAHESDSGGITTLRTESESGHSSADATQVQFSPPGLPLPTPTAPCRWFYLDPKGVVHGPWKASLMQSWYKDSLLPADLPVRREEDTNFTLLRDLRQQSIDPTHPFSPGAPVPPIVRPQEPPRPASISIDSSATTPPFQPTDKPLLKPISLLAQPKHFGPPALFYSSRGGHSTTIVDARGRSVLKDRFFWSDDDNPSRDDDSKPSSLTGRMGDVKRIEAVDIKDRSVLIAMRQGGVEAVDLGDALLRPADASRGSLPQFSPAPSAMNRRQPFVWRIGTPVSVSSNSNASTVLPATPTSAFMGGGKQTKSSGSLPRSTKSGPLSAKSPTGKTDFNLGGDAEPEFHDEAHGGEVIGGSVPPSGSIVLIELGKPDAERLLRERTRPDVRLHVVPYTYVEACQTAGALLKQIFVEEPGFQPMSIHIHESIQNPKFRDEITSRILYAGGNPFSTLQDARVIIADSKTPVFATLVKLTHHSPNKYVESLEWVNRCLEKESVSFTPHVYKNPGGRRAGEERTQFNDEDERKLCEWIALKIPYKETGGRTGNKLYMQLCEMKEMPGYTWVQRHTWQSWRERYKKHAEKLDKIIDEIVHETKPNPGDKVQYGYVRQEEDDKPRKKRKRAAPKNGIETLQQPPPEFVVGASTDSQVLPGAVYQPENVPVSFLPVLAQKPGSSTTNEDENTNWAVRLPDGVLPPWAKRSTQDEKKLKMIEPLDQDAASQQTMQAMVVVAEHVVDQGLRGIAEQHRFTLEEVREYYDRCGDMERTSRRFQKMREHLNLLPDEP
ncbi:hypothetical protein PQX77_013342 [Marasmius sp. AFHP31]|nr:hypothetical protein PQX77_013342 [Marasmius sp. AFHP31]